MSDCKCNRAPEVGTRMIGCPPKVINIKNPEEPVLFHRVDIPAAMGDDTTYPPENGLYKNVLLVYEANGNVYLYNSDGIPTKLTLNIDELENEVERLGIRLEAETEERTAADTVLSNAIDAEATARENADTNLQNAISDEVTARQTADTGLQTQIDAIVASSDVKDIVGTYADLQQYDTSTLGDRDIIKVLQDETHQDETTYYRWSTSTSTFTLIGEEGPYYTKAAADTLLNAKADKATTYTKNEVDAALSDKQDTLIAGSNISIVEGIISATDTTYNNFTGTDGVTAGVAGLVPAPAIADAGKFLKADGTWDTAGSAVNVVQTTGTSTTDVMSQNAVTSMVFADPNNGRRISIGGLSVINDGGIAIGEGAYSTGANTITIGVFSHSSIWGSNNVSIGYKAGSGMPQHKSYVINLGAGSIATETGEMNIGTSVLGNVGYNNTPYRLLTGLHDPQSDHDAATKGYVDTAVAGAGGSYTAGDGIDITDRVISAELVNNLTSTSTTSALTAAQGKALKDQVDAITGLQFSVVQTLPASGSAGTIYLVPNNGTGTNIYDEYIWVNNAWEMLGTTEIDLSNYVTNTALQTILADYATSASLASVATSGTYSDLSGTPTIPTVGDATVTITNNGTTVGSFTTNATANATVALSSPVITMQASDPGEGVALAANNFIAVYNA